MAVGGKEGQGEEGQGGDFSIACNFAPAWRYNGSLRLYVVANISCVSCTETLLIGDYSFTLFLSILSVGNIEFSTLAKFKLYSNCIHVFN